MKTIGIVTELIGKAAARAGKGNNGEWVGIASVKRRDSQHQIWGGGILKGELREVYRVEYDMEPMMGETISLFHYGTLTCSVWKHAGCTEVLEVYGESKSDADSVNTFLSHFGIDAVRYTYKPVNGGFQEVE